MSHDPQNSPTIPGQGGRSHRHVEHSHTTRNVRTDATAERHLKTLGEVLRGYEEADTVSVSMLMRRALAVYFDHIKAIEATPSLSEEFERVREGSVVPSGHRKYAHKPMEKRMQGG
jgi:hypothetical protein